MEAICDLLTSRRTWPQHVSLIACLTMIIKSRADTVIRRVYSKDGKRRKVELKDNLSKVSDERRRQPVRSAPTALRATYHADLDRVFRAQARRLPHPGILTVDDLVQVAWEDFDEKTLPRIDWTRNWKSFSMKRARLAMIDYIGEELGLNSYERRLYPDVMRISQDLQREGHFSYELLQERLAEKLDRRVNIETLQHIWVCISSFREFDEERPPLAPLAHNNPSAIDALADFKERLEEILGVAHEVFKQSPKMRLQFCIVSLLRALGTPFTPDTQRSIDDIVEADEGELIVYEPWLQPLICSGAGLACTYSEAVAKLGLEAYLPADWQEARKAFYYKDEEGRFTKRRNIGAIKASFGNQRTKVARFLFGDY